MCDRQIIATKQVDCVDCYRCVRVCPVKAIGIEQGHASVIPERCILCGRCVLECPHQAKQVENQTPAVREALQQERRVVLSLAPSFVAAFADIPQSQLLRRLYGLGFVAVTETAQGADLVACAYKRAINSRHDGPIISVCCPVVVNMVEQYYPELIPCLAPFRSPILTHGELLKQRYGQDAFVVFACPCIAKIDEARRFGEGLIDAVLTFTELRNMLEQTAPTESGDAAVPDLAAGPGRYFPIAGGILKSFMEYNVDDTDVVAVDGVENCLEVFDGIKDGTIKPRFVEALACAGGCINGPAMGLPQNTVLRRREVICYAKNRDKSYHIPALPVEKLARRFTARSVHMPKPTEEQIAAILRKTGKFTKADEKNCGACGYNTCRDKAVAVFQGLAEVDMCVPYMRERAESFANLIVDATPNAIIVINESLIIQSINQAARNIFVRGPDVTKGMLLSDIMDCHYIIQAINTGHPVKGVHMDIARYGVVTEQTIIPVKDRGLVVVILSDITEREKQARELARMRNETVSKASEIITKQMQVAQEIAGLLGETTAETKVALLELIGLLKGREKR